MLQFVSRKIFLSAYPNEEANKVAANLRRVHQLSDQRHDLVDAPEQADLLLIGGIGNEMDQRAYLQQSACNPLIDHFPEKAFTFSYRDHPVVFNRGVYESGLANAWNRGRCLTGSYELSGHCNAVVGTETGCEKDLLFSFIGRMSHSSRRTIMATKFQRPDIVLEDTSEFNYWESPLDLRTQRERHFAKVLARSKFCLCPRGVGTGSIRLFEAMRAGVAPVIISDDWIQPAGIPWQQCSIRVQEADLHRLEQIVASQEKDHVLMGALARQYWQQSFAETNYFNYIVDQCARMQARQKLPEAFYWSMRKTYIHGRRVTAKVRSIARR